jgi:hypothetical protein
MHRRTTDTPECLGDPALNRADEVTFEGLLRAGRFDQGLFTDSGGVLTAVALPGDPAPGTTESFSFFDLAFPASLNRWGEVAFTVILGPPPPEDPPIPPA